MRNLITIITIVLTLGCQEFEVNEFETDSFFAEEEESDSIEIETEATDTETGSDTSFLTEECRAGQVKCLDDKNFVKCERDSWNLFDSCDEGMKCMTTYNGIGGCTSESMVCLYMQTRCIDDTKWIKCENNSWNEPINCPLGTKCISTINKQAGCTE